jgi:threonine/homoserine/homoserine lactone efflux protein
MIEQLAPLILFAAAMCFSPGPNVVMVVATGANFGFRRALPHILGIASGFGVMVIAVGLGLSGLLRAAPGLHAAIQVAGALYLLYLAWRIATAGAVTRAAAAAKPITFFEAALFQLVNPKGWATIVGALATYTVMGDSVMRQTLLIAGILSVTCLLSVAVWAAFGAAIARVLTPARARLFNLAMAGLLVLSLVSVFL